MPPSDGELLTASAPLPVDSATSSSDHLPRSRPPPACSLAVNQGAGLCPPNHDFDPCQTSNPCSPFYNHDTPRGSTDNLKSKSSLHVSVQDLEAQNGLTPAQSVDARPSPAEVRTWKPWTARTRIFTREKSQCLTKPKPRRCDCLADMPKRQKLLIKLLIALAIVGAMVGIGVGISIKVGGGVYKNQNSTAKIGNV